VEQQGALGRTRHSGQLTPLFLFRSYWSGRSVEQVDDAQVAFFIDSLEQWREAMGVERMHLLGHSWGKCAALTLFQSCSKHSCALEVRHWRSPVLEENRHSCR
jgi:pimeloyl-ACP methyl ester carboxylesterase